MAETKRVLFVHAHPDDETLWTGGTLATLIDRGVEVTVVTCTRGEKGEIIPVELQYLVGDDEAIARLREGELREALAILGVTDHRFLGEPGARAGGRQSRHYRDSGMRWGASGAEPALESDADSLTSADLAEVEADIAAVVSEVSPTAIVSYDERGGYGHPDHIRAHQAALRAARARGIPFFAIVSGSSERPGTEADADRELDVRAALDRTRAALVAHRSQVVVDGDRYRLSSGDFQPIETVERFTRLP